MWFIFDQSNDKDAIAVEAKIQETLKERLLSYEEIRRKACKKEVLEAASDLADSILIAQARINKDSLIKPTKPAKPDKPTIKTVLDTMPISPFLEKDSLIEEIDSSSIFR